MVSEEFGFADNIITLVNLFYPVFTLAIYEAVLRFVIERKTKQERSSIITISLVIITLSTFIILAIGPIVGLFDSKLFDNWHYIIILYFLINFEVVTSYFAKGIGKTKLVALSGVFTTIVTILLNVLLLVVFKMGMKGYLLSLALSYLFTILFLLIFGKLWREFGFAKFTLAQVSELIKYSAPMVITIIAWWINTTADKYILEYTCGLSSRGIYAAAYKIPTIISTITTIFIDAWKLTLYDSTEEQTKESVSQVYKYLSFFCCLLTLGLTVGTEVISRIMLSEEYRVAWSTIPILSSAVYYSTMSGYFASIITKEKKTYKLLIGTLAGALLNIVTGLLLIPIWGIRAAAGTTLLGFIITWIIRLFQIKRISPIRITISEIVNSLCIIITCAVFALEFESRYIIGFMGVAIFILVNYRQFVSIGETLIKRIKKVQTRKNKQ